MTEPQPIKVAKPTPTDCNCYLYVKSFLPDLPRSKYLIPNFKPREGRVALFDYDGVPHYAIIGEVTDTGFYIAHESNYKACTKTSGRFVKFTDPAYLGTYWSDDFDE